VPDLKVVFGICASATERPLWESLLAADGPRWARLIQHHLPTPKGRLRFGQHPVFVARKGPAHLLIDSTAIKVEEGRGEFGKRPQHGGRKTGQRLAQRSTIDLMRKRWGGKEASRISTGQGNTRRCTRMLPYLAQQIPSGPSRSGQRDCGIWWPTDTRPKCHTAIAIVGKGGPLRVSIPPR